MLNGLRDAHAGGMALTKAQYEHLGAEVGSWGIDGMWACEDEWHVGIPLDLALSTRRDSQ